MLLHCCVSSSGLASRPSSAELPLLAVVCNLFNSLSFCSQVTRGIGDFDVKDGTRGGVTAQPEVVEAVLQVREPLFVCDVWEAVNCICSTA